MAEAEDITTHLAYARRRYRDYFGAATLVALLALISVILLLSG